MKNWRIKTEWVANKNGISWRIKMELAGGIYWNMQKQYLHPEFIQYVDGETLNLYDCLTHARSVKASMKSGKITFEHVIGEGNKVCTVHIAESITNGGNAVKFKVIAYFELKDNKIRLFDELTRMIDGDDTDRDITSRN